ncbi:alpha-soluble NSF attachment protein-like [Dendronephthya gigantea]|uniref:alpha-soluble NSF attachment protein-like n=1 Tax=Dendronephthya gigantea TaxID=151771 RepID=UPI0010698797|nr:alpha-soluble NSF attachment protein-like [Dendronephthya gigantea]
MSHEAKAAELMAEADRKLKSSQGFLGGFFGGGTKKEEAADLYVRAANTYKLAKNWSGAGNAFCQAAQIQLNFLANKHEAATQYIDAANCYKKSDNDEAISCLQQGIEIYTDMGRFTIAAKQHMAIAEIYEGSVIDLEKAIAHYEQAADFYRGEESNSSANKCSLKVAQYSAQMENFEKAIEIYEQVAADAIESSLLKYSAKEYFFKAALCQMCVDMLEGQRAVDKYCDMYAAFQDTRECKLLRALLEAQEEENVEAFTEAVKNYDSISRLDQWLTTILLKIKKGISEEPEIT